MQKTDQEPSLLSVYAMLRAHIEGCSTRTRIIAAMLVLLTPATGVVARQIWINSNRLTAIESGSQDVKELTAEVRRLINQLRLERFP